MTRVSRPSVWEWKGVPLVTYASIAAHADREARY